MFVHYCCFASNASCSAHVLHLVCFHSNGSCCACVFAFVVTCASFPVNLKGYAELFLSHKRSVVNNS